VSGQVVKGTYDRVEGQLLHRFDIHDLEDESVTFTVEWRDALPDTFTEDVEVVLEGRLNEAGTFEATTLLTKCGSRYEAAPEDLARVTVLGEFALWISLPVALWGMFLGFAGGRTQRGDLVLSAERSIYAVFLLHLVASLGVMAAFLGDKLRVLVRRQLLEP
jgi:hypothetical protein